MSERNHLKNRRGSITFSAVAASLALQYGCPADVLRKALSRDRQGRASSPLGVALDMLAVQP